MPIADVILLTAGLLALAVVVAGLFRRLPLPHSVVLVLVGMALAELGRHAPGANALGRLELTPELVFYVFLPALVFESGLNLDARALLKNLLPVLALAVPALLLSTAVVGLGLWLGAGVALLVALLFGALISATDPVAVVALFSETGAPERLRVLVEGESLLNDATAIVVFTLLLGLVGANVAVDAGLLAGAAADFLVVFLGGVAVGVALGAAASELTHRLHSAPSAVLAMSAVTAWAGFILAEHLLHVSGVMATVAASLTFAALGAVRLERETRHALGETWALVALVCNSLLFLLVGLSVDLVSLAARWPLVALAVVLVMAARALSAYALLPLTTRLFALPRVGLGDRHILWWGGLKGGLAIAIALSVPAALPERQLVLDLTVGVVLFTLLVNAATLRPLMHALRLDRLSADERAELRGALVEARSQADASLRRYRGLGLLSSAAHHELADALARRLAPPAGGNEPHERLRDVHLTALRAEADALAALHAGGAVGQYSYLELRDILVREREAADGGHESEGDAAADNPFARVEAALLGRLREHDFAAGLLARYQSLRLRQHVERNACGVVMGEAALAALAGRDDLDPALVADVAGRYRARVTRRRQALAAVRTEFPAFFERLEADMSRRAALDAALQTARAGEQQGHLGAKAYARLAATVAEALAQAPPVGDVAERPRPADLIRAVPLFAGLSSDSVTALAAAAWPLTFLPGDVVIAEGAHGDALYIVTRGEVAVSRHAGAGEQPVATLGDGAVFGEAALLTEAPRNATVTATAPTTLLRLGRRDVLALAETLSELGERLRAVDRARHAGGPSPPA